MLIISLLNQAIFMLQKGALQKWIKIVNWCKAQINFGSALYNSLIYTTHNLVYIRLI